MVLICSCTHKRKNHEGGLDNIRDKTVTRCKENNCTCTKYNPNNKSRDKPYISKTISRALGIGLAGIILIIVGFVLVDVVLEQFNVELVETVERYIDGELQETQYTPKESLAFIIKSIYGFGIGVPFLYWGLFYLQEFYEAQKRKAMLEDE